MLVLSRKKNEAVIIDDNIVVTVVEVRGDKVRLGFDAPQEIKIHRQEIWLTIHEPPAEGDNRDVSETAVDSVPSDQHPVFSPAQPVGETG